MSCYCLYYNIQRNCCMLDQKKSIWAWALYDWANSAFVCTVVAGFFPVFFKQYWAGGVDPKTSTFLLGSVNSAASLILAVFGPFLGAIADRGSAKKKFLFVFAYLGVIMTGCLWLVNQGNWGFAMLFYIISSLGFFGGNIFYDSLLPAVASKEKCSFVSSLGYAMGYIGGGLLFLVNVLMYQQPSWFGIADGPTAIRISFLTVAVWWAVFSIPVFLFVKEPENYEPTPLYKAIGSGWQQLINTLKEIRQLKVVVLFVIAYWLYIDGVDTVIKMAVDYGASLNFPTSSLITALLIVQFIAFPSALVYNWIGSKIGTKKAILMGIIGYSFIVLLGYFMSKVWHFYFLAVLVALFQGGIQALSRSLYTRIIPANKSGEFFGFYNLLGKFASIIGPVLMGSVTLLTGNIRIGILSILVLFILGGFMLMKVDVAEGERIAEEYLTK